MRTKPILLLALVAVITLSCAHVCVAQPPIPHAFYGSLRVYGPGGTVDAPAGVVVEAIVDGSVCGSITTTEAGKYGGPEALDDKLVVQGYIDNGTTIYFYVNDVKADQTWPFTIGDVTQLNLAVKDDVPPSVPTDVVRTTPGNDSTPAFSWTASTDALAGVDHYEVRVDTGSWTSIGNVTFWTSSTVPDGSHTFYVMAVDRANNFGDPASLPFSIDTVPPSVPTDVVRTTPGSNSTPAFSWTASTDALAGVDHYEVRVDSDNWTSIGNVTSWTSSTVPDGSHTFYVMAVDRANNFGDPASLPFSIDTVAPTISGISASGIIPTGATITWTTDEPATSQVEYGTTSAYGYTTALISTLTTSHSVGLGGLTPSTTYHYRVRSADAATNLSVSGDYTFATAAPMPPLPGKATLTVDTIPMKGEVFVDGSSWGTAPQTRELDAGTYTVSFGAVSGYTTPPPQTVTLAAGETRTVTGTYAVVPPEKATLTVDTIPIKASVYVDGSLWGIAPQTRSLDAGTYTVSFGDVLGYLTPGSETVTLAADEARTVTGVYTEIPPEIVENVSPTYELPSITPEENATVEVENTAITELTIRVENAVENVRVTVQQLTERPAEIEIAAPGISYKYLDIVAQNVTDVDIESVTITFKVEKSWIAEHGINEATITLRRYAAGEWTSLPTEKIDEDDTYVYFSAVSPGLSIYAVSGATLAPASFEFSNLRITPPEVGVGELTTISIDARNTGELEGTYTVALRIDGVTVETRDVTLAPGASTTVTFTVSEDVAGTYAVDVAGLTGSFVVTAPPALPAPLIVPLAVTIIIIALAIGIILWLRRVRRRA